VEVGDVSGEVFHKKKALGLWLRRVTCAHFLQQNVENREGAGAGERNDTSIL
jgi:hypothetical protein